MRTAGPALEAHAAREVGFGRHEIPDRDRRDVGSDFHDIAAQFMADDARWVDATLRPFVPAIDVVVGSAE